MKSLASFFSSWDDSDESRIWIMTQRLILMNDCRLRWGSTHILLTSLLGLDGFFARCSSPNFFINGYQYVC